MPVERVDSRTNQPSSSSRRLGAGKGAPEPSVVGRRTYPDPWKGFMFLMEDSNPVFWDVLTGSSLRRLHPSELNDSRSEVAMVGLGCRREAK